MIAENGRVFDESTDFATEITDPIRERNALKLGGAKEYAES